MAKIENLVNDIYRVLNDPSQVENWDESLDIFVANIREMLTHKLAKRDDSRSDGLRMSNFGNPDRKLWYKVNEPDKEEQLPPQAYLKFLYGDIIEELILFLARVSGHTVEAEQERVYAGPVPGHIDAIIDGHLVDVKSAASRSFDKFKYHNLEKDDPFHYLDQITGYMEGLRNDPRLTDKTHASFLAVDKEKGYICLDTYEVKSDGYVDEAERKLEVLASNTVPPRCHPAVPDGKSGNMKLGLECSYCGFKKHCWPMMRTFLYARGPVHLTEVKREPDVPEVN